MVSTLFLVPTPFELNLLSRSFLEELKHRQNVIECCGFGPIVSPIRTTQLISQYLPTSVFLLGIAGAYDPNLKIGSALEFDEATCFGVGTGSGDGFLSSSEMGWSQWQGEPEITDSIKLDSLAASPETRSRSAKLLSCCAASADRMDVQLRLRKHPDAVAEDMEGFSVAAACRFAGTPLRIVRGISNLAGDRDKTNWRIQEAMKAVEDYVREVIET